MGLAVGDQVMLGALGDGMWVSLSYAGVVRHIPCVGTNLITLHVHSLEANSDRLN